LAGVAANDNRTSARLSLWCIEACMDEDLEIKTREQLIAEVKRLRAGIRAHRDSSGHELCWHHPALWGLLPEQIAPQIAVPEWPQFLRGCIRYRQSLDEQQPQARRTQEESKRG
jgi:hypothetical protein